MRADEDYKAGSFLSGLFLELHGNDKKQAMKFALDLTSSEWFNRTSKFLKKNDFFDGFYFLFGTVATILSMVSGGWLIYLLIKSALIITVGVVIILVLESFLTTIHQDHRMKSFNKRVKRGNIKDFGPHIEQVVIEKAKEEKMSQGRGEKISDETIKTQSLNESVSSSLQEATRTGI